MTALLRKPLIGIPTRFADQSSTFQRTLAVREPNIRCVLNAGGIPIAIPHTASESELLSYYGMIDGLFLAGGEDIDPKHFHQQPDPKLGEVCQDRDRSELLLTKKAFADNMPILAICRGIQLLNVALGGSMIQDIPSASKEYLMHRAPNDEHDCLHSVTFAEDSIVSTALGMTNFKVNSYHHQAITEVPESMRITGTASDGIIEGIEGLRNRFVVGVQCHPEFHLKDDPTSVWSKLFDAFVASCQK